MRILIAGATGLVGQRVLRECLRADDVSHVVTLGHKVSGQSDPEMMTPTQRVGPAMLAVLARAAPTLVVAG